MKDDTRGNALLVVAICLITITTAFVAARLWARFVMLRKAGLDDYTIIPAYFVSVSATVLTLIKCYRYGYNGHVWELGLSGFYMGTIYNYFETILYTLARALVNISFLFLYLRVFSRSNKTLFRRIIIGSIIIISLYSTASILSWMFQCWPIEAYWRQFSLPDPYREPFECFSTTPLEQFTVIIIVLTQIWIALLPLYVIQRVKVTTRQKEVLFMLVGLGALVVGASAASLYHQMRMLTGNHIDSTWEEYPSFIWNLVALYTAMICACVPGLNIFVANLLAPKGILARLHKRRDRLRGVPEVVDAFRQAEPEDSRTRKSCVLARDATSVGTDEATDAESQPQMPDRAVMMKETNVV